MWKGTLREQQQQLRSARGAHVPRMAAPSRHRLCAAPRLRWPLPGRHYHQCARAPSGGRAPRAPTPLLHNPHRRITYNHRRCRCARGLVAAALLDAQEAVDRVAAGRRKRPVDDRKRDAADDARRERREAARVNERLCARRRGYGRGAGERGRAANGGWSAVCAHAGTRSGARPKGRHNKCAAPRGQGRGPVLNAGGPMQKTSHGCAGQREAAAHLAWARGARRLPLGALT